MGAESARSASGETNSLILRALVRKLVDKGMLSPDDVNALLLDAAKGLDVAGGDLTAEAAETIVREDLAPLYSKSE